MNARDTHAVLVAKALGDPTRFRLLKVIAAHEEISCAELVAKGTLSQATVSHHLKVLADAGLISVRRSGPYHHYRALTEALAAHAAALTAAVAPRRTKHRNHATQRSRPTARKEQHP